MSKSYYVLIDTSIVDKKAVSTILDKLSNPYNDSILFNKVVFINQYILACNYETENSYNMKENDKLHMVCRGSLQSFDGLFEELSKNSNFTDIDSLCSLLRIQHGNFSFIAMNSAGDFITATDQHGMEKIYIGHKGDKPILFSNYNITTYFGFLYDFNMTNITSIPDGYINIYRKNGITFKKYCLDEKPKVGIMDIGIMGHMPSFLDGAFGSLLPENSVGISDFETKKGKYGTSILDRIMCWDDTQKRFNLYPPPDKSINIYEGNFCMENYLNPDYTTKIDVINEDWIDQVIEMKNRGLTPILLNMTDRNFPGCNIFQGTGGQEETIFRRSNFSETLIVDLYPFNIDNRVIYSPNVTIFKSSEKSGWSILNTVETIGILSAPPIKTPYNLIYDYTTLFENAKLNEEHASITKTYLEIVFVSAIRIGCDSLVLPAFGCEGHKNPARHIASIIKELCVKYNGYFKEIVIAMPEIDDHLLGNYTIFKEVLVIEKPLIGCTKINNEFISNLDVITENVSFEEIEKEFK